MLIVKDTFTHSGTTYSKGALITDSGVITAVLDQFPNMVVQTAQTADAADGGTGGSDSDA